MYKERQGQDEAWRAPIAAPQGLGLGLQPLLWMQRSMANSLK